MKSKKIVLSGLFIALGVVVPMIFHTVNLAGPIFLPMHIPVLLAGFLLGPVYGGIVGIICPVISGLATGMPPLMPNMPIMAFELCGYGILTGFLYNKTRMLYPSLIGAMIGGRIFAIVGAFVVSITVAPAVHPLMFVVGGLGKAIPGMIVQLIAMPLLMELINRSEVAQNLLQ